MPPSATHGGACLSGDIRTESEKYSRSGPRIVPARTVQIWGGFLGWISRGLVKGREGIDRIGSAATLLFYLRGQSGGDPDRMHPSTVLRVEWENGSIMKNGYTARDPGLKSINVCRAARNQGYHSFMCKP
ncbi:hypothetical protein IV203_013974 [Nitzschia inconspicua]|uniref:Uncharacterized protein n=1 Tax=Nitzschia inconspicua TaxID=303405 RepID=A0A9K3K873_9STRA|nr:hypothetical protein IV203_014245 [Nitzschia inconspicua]KAG7374879.1 hypothetical protein IV203_013974 [Nitzschia inconspicua]